MGVDGAIPTVYNNTQFRSRLEARWAAFFEALGWTYVYEPFDGKGYIPDFMVDIPALKDPVLIEIKPAVTERDYVEALGKMVDGTPTWQHSILVLGVAPYYRNRRNITAGEGWTPAHPEATPTAVWWVREGSGVSLRPCYSRLGVVSGSQLSCNELDELWRSAGNKVQWKKPGAAMSTAEQTQARIRRARAKRHG